MTSVIRQTLNIPFKCWWMWTFSRLTLPFSLDTAHTHRQKKKKSLRYDRCVELEKTLSSPRWLATRCDFSHSTLFPFFLPYYYWIIHPIFIIHNMYTTTYTALKTATRWPRLLRCYLYQICPSFPISFWLNNLEPSIRASHTYSYRRPQP